MTEYGRYENSKCIVRVWDLADIPKLDKPTIVIKADLDDFKVLKRGGELPYRSVNEAIDYLCQPTRIEKVLEFGKSVGRKFGRRELTDALDHRNSIRDRDECKREARRLEGMYGLNTEHTIFSELAHGFSTNPNSYSPNRGITCIGEITSGMTVGPTSSQPNLFEQFHRIGYFYDFCLEQHTSNMYKGKKREGRDQFFQLKTMEEVNQFLGEYGVIGVMFKEALAKVGITTVEQMQTRIRQFEDEYFPNEFEKAVQEIRLTRQYLQSLKD